MDIFVVATDRAPTPLGPYSQAVRASNVIFLSGQIALDPKTEKIKGKTVAEQTKQALNNLAEVLKCQGLSLKNVVKTTVFLRSMASFAEFNTAYQQAFGVWKPARSVVEVSALPKDALIEIEGIACR
ncbi:MAG: Rid family detoxifying hydrolase [Chitinivibrionales bacterium]|nr:Rid family detoxifying hydrolase [Chitinivibrionales bacterium]